MNFRAFLLATVAALTAVTADVDKINHDQVQPFAQPKPITDSEKSAAKYKPQLHITYGCRPYPAVQANGSVSGGLKWGGKYYDGGCTGSALGSQVYSRSDWYMDKWAIMYACSSPTNSSILGVSMSAGVGYGKETPPKSKYVVNATTVKLESDWNYWVDKQALRLTTKGGETQDLTTWEQLPDKARGALSEFQFKPKWSWSKSVMPLKDGVFESRLKKAYPF